MHCSLMGKILLTLGMHVWNILKQTINTHPLKQIIINDCIRFMVSSYFHDFGTHCNVSCSHGGEWNCSRRRGSEEFQPAGWGTPTPHDPASGEEVPGSAPPSFVEEVEAPQVPTGKVQESPEISSQANVRLVFPATQGLNGKDCMHLRR